MSSIIKLLPENIANQIAAGEVINRPASVVKELMENSIDAGATHVSLILEDAGKQLVQVVDNGSGMNELDARMCLERHATSKIKSADDLCSISTFGFRGEALASIVSISDVELKSRTADSKLGLRILVRGSEIVKQEHCQAPVGTSIAVKNLFFNVPVRRKFLKSDAVELKHILDEFYHVALAYPEIAISLHHNKKETYLLEKNNLRQRIISLFGKSYNDKLIHLEQEASSIRIEGYIGKPELAKKSRSGSYLFLNNRFIKNHYLAHAVKSGFANLIPDTHSPFFVLNIHMLPGEFDVNVHPTKQEVRFANEKLLYDIIRAIVRHSLASHSIGGPLDFEETINNFSTTSSPSHTEGSPLGTRSLSASSSEPKITRHDSKAWRDFYEDIHNDAIPHQEQQTSGATDLNGNSDLGSSGLSLHSEQELTYMVLSRTHLMVNKDGAIFLINYPRGKARILYERMSKQIKNSSLSSGSSQTLMFPVSIELSNKHHQIALQKAPELERLGFELSDLGDDTIVLHAIPADLNINTNFKELFEALFLSISEWGQDENLAFENKFWKTIAQNTVRYDNLIGIQADELAVFVQDLYSCDDPDIDPEGNKTFVSLDKIRIEKLFN